MNLLATSLMTGIVWFVQLVHYPLFRVIPIDFMAEYERLHSQRTGRLVIPLMIIELVSATAMVVVADNSVSQIAAIVGLGLLGVVWISTFALQVPAHRALSASPQPGQIRRLVNSNWLRTVAWSLRTLLLFGMLAEGLR